MTVRRYDFHGVLLSVAADHGAVIDAVDDRLRHFRSARNGVPGLQFRYRIAPGAAAQSIAPPSGPSRRVYELPVGDVRYFRSDDLLYVDYQSVRVLCAPREGTVDISSVAPGTTDVWLLSRPLLTLPFVELLKRQGLYSVHAAGVTVGDRAVLLPGASGAGKSTLAVALARAGLPFLSDDMVFLSSPAADIRVHAFPDEADISNETAGWFEELEGLVGARPNGWPKHRVRMEDVFATSVTSACAPGVLVFPRISPDARSALMPMSPDDALRELAPNVLLTDPVSSQAHLDALAQLVRDCRIYRLATGRDFERIAELVCSIADQ